jgi:predicted dehydrogenase
MKRAALIGCGRIGAFTRDELRHRLPAGWFPLSHLEAMRMLPQLDVVAAADLSPEALLRVTAEFAIPRTYRDFDELLDNEKIDLLAIATRAPQRIDIIKKAVGTGVKAIHAEKPLGNQMKATAEAVLLCEDHGVFLTYGTTRRYMKVYRAAKRLLEEGAIGELLEIQIQFGKTLLLWTHPHSIDLMLYFNGAQPIRRVQGVADLQTSPLNNVLDEDPVIRHALVQFENGVIGTLSPAGGGNVMLLGSKGQIEILGEGAELNLRLHKSGMFGTTTQPVSFDVSPSGTLQAFIDLAQALENGTPVEIAYAEIIEGTRGLLMIALSALRDGTFVYPEDLSEDFTVTGRAGDLLA